MQQTEDRSSLVDQIERASLHLKLPATPLHLDDGQLLEYRHPTEKPMLWVSLVTLAMLLGTLVVFDKRQVLFAIVGIWLSTILASLQAAHYNTLRGAEVTSSQFPAIFQIVEELCQRFQMPPTRVFVFRKGGIEPDILGLRAPYVIALPSLLLDSLQPDELRNVLGQATGHIRLGYTRMAILLGGRPIHIASRPILGRSNARPYFRRSPACPGVECRSNRHPRERQRDHGFRGADEARGGEPPGQRSTHGGSCGPRHIAWRMA